MSAGNHKHFQDRRFFDTFMLVLGILIAIAFGLWFLAHQVASATQEKHVAVEPVMKAAVASRIEPVGKVAIAGRDNSALEPAAKGGAPEAAAAAAELGGEEVFNTACMACHGAGVAGAPKYGDKPAWAPRIAQGLDTLHKRAIGGFQGKAGFMPPKGGRVDLSDKSIMNGVDYMVAGSK
ncbi:MAG: c-type cytochrome [Steroidobacteraceae bacterium]